MTKQEFTELYDLLYHGHDAELSVFGKHYFVEWMDAGIAIYLLIDGNGTKMASISGTGRHDVLSELFDFKLDGCRCLNTSYNDIEIVDIE